MKLKKLSAFALSLLAVGALVSCGQATETPTPTPTDKTEEKTPTQAVDGIMTYAQYVQTSPETTGQSVLLRACATS